MSGEPRTLSGWVTRTGLLGTDAEGRLVSTRVVLRVSRGPDTGQTVELDAGSAILGSHRTCDLRLTDRGVSRKHVELLLLSGAVRVRDLESKNGSFVGASRIEDATLPLPFELRLGATHVEVRAADVPLPMPVSERSAFGALVGESHAMRRVFGVMERVAATDVPVLASGEPGVGKTAVCAALHHASGRTGSLLYLDPGRSLDRPTLDAALEAARGGSLLLERIDEWPRHATDALVGALDARDALPARLLSTASGDVQRAVEDGRLPRSLWFFLGSVHLALPPLSARQGDVPVLVSAFLRELGHAGPPPREIAQQAARGLPGNVRELRAIVEAAVATRAPPRTPPEAPREPMHDPSLPYHEAKAELLDEFERRYLVELMERHDGVVLHAAEEAGLGRNHLARLLKKHGLK